MAFKGLRQELDELFGVYGQALDKGELFENGSMGQQKGPHARTHTVDSRIADDRPYRDPAQRRADKAARVATLRADGYYKKRYERRKAEGWFDNRSWRDHRSPKALENGRALCRAYSAGSYVALTAEQRKERNATKRAQRSPEVRKAEQARYHASLTPEQKRARQDRQNERRRLKRQRADDANAVDCASKRP